MAFVNSLGGRITERPEGKTLEVSSGDALLVLKALASPGRMQILRVLGEGQRNITQLALATGQTQPTVTQSIKHLQQAGLVDATLRPVPQGHEKICTRTYDNIVVRLPSDTMLPDHLVSEIAMPVGRYRSFDVRSPCGLVSEAEIIGLLDDPQSFNDPRHVFAELLWFADGYVEYTVPLRIPPGNAVASVDLSVEICSEAPGNDPHHASDITVWINGHDIGTWVCPGDFGDSRGRLTPRWWPDRYTQYGLLKHWKATPAGTYLDGSWLSSATVDDLELGTRGPLQVRFGIRTDAKHRGGINLFGSKFGNYGQDIVVRVDFEPVSGRRSGQ